VAVIVSQAAIRRYSAFHSMVCGTVIQIWSASQGLFLRSPKSCCRYALCLHWTTISFLTFSILIGTPSSPHFAASEFFMLANASVVATYMDGTAYGPQEPEEQKQNEGLKAGNVNKQKKEEQEREIPKELRRRWLRLINEQPYDVVEIRGVPKPIKVRPTLPRPFRPKDYPSRRRFRLHRIEGRGRTRFTLTAREIKRVTHFEEILEKEARAAIAVGAFDWALELIDRLRRYNPGWGKVTEMLTELGVARVERMLAAQSPRFDEALSLCQQLAAEHADDSRVQHIFRKVVVLRVRSALRDGDYPALWDAIHAYRRFYSLDEELTAVERKLWSEAGKLVGEAELAMSQGLEERRRALQILAKARLVYPDYPGLDRLIEEARRSYPVLVVGVSELPKVFEPLGASSLVEHQACQLIFDRLTDWDITGRQLMRGPFVSKWQQRELGKVHEIELRHDLFWSDGRRVTAYDVSSSIELWRNPKARNYDPERARFIGATRVLDPFRIEIRLRAAHVRPYDLLSLFILPRHKVVEPPAPDSAFSQTPVGTGPFRVGRDRSDQLVRFVVNTRFRDMGQGLPYIKEIRFRQFVNRGTALRELENGNVHMVTWLGPEDVIRFSKLPGRFEVQRYLSNSVYILAFNHRREPFDNRDFRRAVLLAINREAILRQYYHAGEGGLAHRVVTGPFPTHSPAYNQEVPLEGQNLALAASLIKELIKGGQFSNRLISLKYPLGDRTLEKAASQMRKDLMKAGLRVRTEAKLPRDLRREVIDQHDFDIVYWRLDHRNVLYNISSLFDPASTGRGGTNFMGYTSSRLEALFERLRYEQRPLELWQIQRQIHRLLYDEVVFVPLWQLDNYIAYTTNLSYRVSGDKLASRRRYRLPIHPYYLFSHVEGWYLEP